MSFGDDHNSTDELERAARKRWLTLMGTVTVVVAIAVPLLTPILNPNEHHKHHSTVTSVVIGAISAAIVIAIGLLLLRRLRRRNNGFFAAPTIMGLKRSERRKVTRAVRRGTPSADDRLAAVEISTAHRTIEQSTKSRVIFSIAVLGTLAECLVTNTTAGRIFYGCGAAFFVLMSALQFRAERQARRYLAASAE